MNALFNTYSILSAIFILSLTVISCSEEDINTISSEGVERIGLTDDCPETCANSTVFDPTFSGTACCTQRNSELNIGDTVEYEYFTNLTNPNVNWEVNSGDIEIISGSKSSVVRIRLGNSFTKGEIHVLGTERCLENDDFECVCGHLISITKNETK